MKKSFKILSIFTVIFIFLLSFTNCNNSGSNNNNTDSVNVEHNIDDNHHEDETHWSYAGETGPENWATMSEDFSDCGGQAQSPVDISQAVKGEDLKPLFLDYQPCKNIEILNNGHSIQVNYNTGIFVNKGVDFNLKQFHFHCPSEFTYNGEHFPMEIHFVHADSDGNLAVIGLMVTEGAENEFFNKFWDKLPKKEGKSKSCELELNLSELLPANISYYHLMGSLTTPPCTENVQWYLLKTPIEASKEQIEKIASIMPKNNNRPVQPLNGREIFEF